MLVGLSLLWIVVACDGEPETDTDSGGDTAPACTVVDGDFTPDEWGGDSRVQLEATGWFRTEQLCERWWLVTPDGHPFFSSGVNSVRHTGSTNQVTGEQAYAQTVAAEYESTDAWADATAERLREWGFTTVGSWSDSARFSTRMPIAVNLSLALDDWMAGTVSDYHDPAWVAAVQQRAVEQTAPYVDNPNVIGWFIDNENRWGPDWRGTKTLLQVYMALPAEAPGKIAAVTALMDDQGSLDAVNTLLGTEHATEAALLADVGPFPALEWTEPEARAVTAMFLARTAEAYFDTTSSAIRAADPNHMVLCNREVASLTPAALYEAMVPHCDVVSINNYVMHDSVIEGAVNLSGAVDPANALALPYEVLQKPILISEFGFRADGAGPPNTWPPIYPTYADQTERTAAFEAYVTEHQAAPWIVGYHWFQWVDQPVDGRFDGEDNNWGLVSEADVPYPELTGKMAELNPAIYQYLAVE